MLSQMHDSCTTPWAEDFLAIVIEDGMNRIINAMTAMTAAPNDIWMMCCISVRDLLDIFLHLKISYIIS